MIDTIREAEQKTSGEIRVFIEAHCKFMDAIDRAKEIFDELSMHQTKERNATLVYIAVKDHQLAIYGDEGIHQRVGQAYWETEVRKMIDYFSHNQLADGLCECVRDIGEALHQYFPYKPDSDKNELPDDIVFGKI